MIHLFQHTIEAIGTAAGNAIQGPVNAAVRDILVPGFDRACQALIHQVQLTFQSGTQECKYK